MSGMRVFVGEFMCVLLLQSISVSQTSFERSACQRPFFAIRDSRFQFRSPGKHRAAGMLVISGGAITPPRPYLTYGVNTLIPMCGVFGRCSTHDRLRQFAVDSISPEAAAQKTALDRSDIASAIETRSVNSNYECPISNVSAG